MQQTKLIPKLFTVFKEGYTQKNLANDIIAGIIVGIVALPLSIALAIASGVKPEQGLYTAVIAGFLISVLGGSRFQIGGPTGAFIVIVYNIVQQYGYDGLATATLMAGVLLILMGVSRLGSVIKFIPYPLTVGFTSGIALIIGVSQFRDFLGLNMDDVPAEFLDKCFAYSENIMSANFYAVGIGLLSLLIIVYWPRITKKIPGSLIAILIATLMVQMLNLPVETIESRFGTVSGSIPAPRLPSMNWDLITSLSSPALAIAILAGIESLLSAVVADGMTGTRHRSNMELVAQGVANIASPIFGGIPATGAIARTATNIKNGGKTPVAGIVHALTILVIILFFGKWASWIPMATLSAILIMVAYNMSEWRLFMGLFRSPKADVMVLLTSFLLTVFVDLTVAIEVGVVLAALLFMHRMSSVTQAGYITKSLNEEDDINDPNSLKIRSVPDGVEVFEIYGPFFFGAADQFKDALRIVDAIPKVLILRLREVFALDATALRALEDVYRKTVKDGTILVLSGVHAQPLITIERSGLFDVIGEENILGNIDSALNRARTILGLPEIKRPGPFVPTVARENAKSGSSE
ncbi:MAG: SulP family inorganic anion transporter [Calditrichaceae bacterium]